MAGADRVAELQSWDDVRFLSVSVDRLRRWHRPGVLCIGDAAHAMSPAGGVGINLAVQDAVATANILGPSLRRGGVPQLGRVERRARVSDPGHAAGSAAVARGLYPRDMNDDRAQRMPLAFRLFRSIPALRFVTGRFIGLGVRPEHLAASTPQ